MKRPICLFLLVLHKFPTFRQGFLFGIEKRWCGRGLTVFRSGLCGSNQTCVASFIRTTFYVYRNIYLRGSFKISNNDIRLHLAGWAGIPTKRELKEALLHEDRFEVAREY